MKQIFTEFVIMDRKTVKIIFGEREKEGYYVSINFEKYTDENYDFKIKKICFGWINYEDRIPRKKK